MVQAVGDACRSVLTRSGARPASLLGVTFLVVLAVPVFLRQPQDWESVYIPAASRLAQRSDIFQDDFVYPPINAWLALPFVEMSWLPARAIWYAINMTALSILLIGSWKLSGGGRLEGSPSVPWRERAIFCLGLGCGISSCLDAITNQQTDLIVGALVILGCLALVRERSLWATVWFGVAAAIKCTPLLWAPYLAWQKRWKACVLVIVVAGGVNFIPDFTHPAETSTTHLGDWLQRFLMPMADRKHDLGSWNCGIGGNQSVAGVCQRWLIHDTTWDGNHLLGVPSEARAAPEMLKAVTWGILLALLTAGLTCTWKTRPHTDPLRGSQSDLGLQFGMVLILMVLLSPHSSKPHFCTLLLPGFCVARAALNWPNRRLLLVLLAALTCAVASNNDLVGSWLYSWSKWHGTLAWCAVLLYAGSCRVLLVNCTKATENKPALMTEPMRQAA